MLVIRQYHDADNQAVWDLHRKALEPTGAYFPDGKWDYDLHNITEHYLNNDGEFLVGLLENKIVCMGAFRKKSATQAEVKRMRVLPEFQRQGFGQAILNQLEDRAQQMDYTELILDTTTKQLSAQILYEKNGFVEVKREMLPPFELIIYRKTRYNQLRVNKAKIGLCSGLNISFPNAYLLTCSNLLEGVLRDILFHYSKALCGTN